MSKLIIAFVVGIIVGSIGFSGVTRLLDRGVETVRSQVQEMSE